MPNSVSRPTLTRRCFTQLSGIAVGSLALFGAARAAAATKTNPPAMHTFLKKFMSWIGYSAVSIVCQNAWAMRIADTRNSNKAIADTPG
jgi:hypothetical protein